MDISKHSAPPPLADDLMDGANEIAEFLYGRPVTPEKKRRVYYIAERRTLPIFTIGSILHARKSTLRAEIAKREARTTRAPSAA
jgi:hypothetical protein